jgi:hypothetical protein
MPTYPRDRISASEFPAFQSNDCTRMLDDTPNCGHGACTNITLSAQLEPPEKDAVPRTFISTGTIYAVCVDIYYLALPKLRIDSSLSQYVILKKPTSIP